MAAMAPTFYAQFGEDRILADLLPHRDGVFVEVGANDGVTGSATCYFERERGWSGVLVEANPDLIPALRANRPGATVMAYAAVAPHAPERVSFQVADADPQLSSLRISSDQMRRVPDRQTREVQVAARTLDEILLLAGLTGQIDLLTIDVEGFERDVLRGFNLHAWRPSWVLIENNGYLPDGWVSRKMRRRGYRLVRRTGVNYWWQRTGDPGSQIAEWWRFTLPLLPGLPKALLRGFLVRLGVLR